MTMREPKHIQLTYGNGEMRPLAEIEADVIEIAIKHYDRNMSQVAARLKIGRTTLYRKTESRARY